MFTFDENTDLVELYFDHVTMDEDEEYVPKEDIEDPHMKEVVEILCDVLNELFETHGDNAIDGFKDGPEGLSSWYMTVHKAVNEKYY